MRFLQYLNLPQISGKPSGGADRDFLASSDGNIYFKSNGVWVPVVFDGLAKLFGLKFWPSPSTNNKLLVPVFGAITTQALTAGRCYFQPAPITMPVTLTHLGISVSTASAGTAEVALYRGDGTNGNPYTRVAYASGIDTGTTGEKMVSVGSIALEPGLYWAAVRGTAAATLRASATSLVLGISGTTLYRALYNSDASLTNPVTTTPTNLHANAILVLARWS